MIWIAEGCERRRGCCSVVELSLARLTQRKLSQCFPYPQPYSVRSYKPKLEANSLTLAAVVVVKLGDRYMRGRKCREGSLQSSGAMWDKSLDDSKTPRLTVAQTNSWAWVNALRYKDDEPITVPASSRPQICGRRVVVVTYTHAACTPVRIAAVDGCTQTKW